MKRTNYVKRLSIILCIMMVLSLFACDDNNTAESSAEITTERVEEITTQAQVETQSENDEISDTHIVEETTAEDTTAEDTTAMEQTSTIENTVQEDTTAIEENSSNETIQEETSSEEITTHEQTTTTERVTTIEEPTVTEETTTEEETTREVIDVSGKSEANVIIVSGQSNAYGATPITDLITAEAEKYDFSNVYIKYMNINCDGEGLWKPFYSNEAFEEYRLGIGAEGKNRIGPEFGIICYLIDNGMVTAQNPLYVIKYTAASTVLNSQWLPSNKFATVDNNKLVSDLGGHLSGLMGDYIYDALKEIAQTHAPNIRSFFWLQGESDAQQSGVVNGYGDAEQELVSSLRKHFGIYSSEKGISFIDYAIQETEECGFKWRYAHVVNNAKELNCEYYLNADVSTSFANVENNRGASIKNSMLIAGDNLLITKKTAGEDENDCYHLASESMYKLGRMMGRAMLYLAGETVGYDPIVDVDVETQPDYHEPVEPTMDYVEYTLSQNVDNVKVLGRTQFIGSGLACDTTGSGIAFKAYIENEVRITITATKLTYYTVFVDGVRLDERFEVNGKGIIVIDGLGEKKLREIEIVKQTEPQLSLSVIESIGFNGTLEGACEDRELYIEFLGDSITSGYGNLCPKGTENAGTAPYQDGTATYAYLTAKALNADFSALSCSGIGIDRGWTNWEQFANGFSMDDFYPCTSFYRSRDEKYDFSTARVPDIVVINLGTNDKSLSSDVETFKAGVRSLIEFIRTSYNKDVPIVWVYNMLGDGYFTYTQTVLDEMGGESAGIYYVKMVPNSGGGSGHPTGEAHVVSAETLTAFLREKGLAE